jgi:hypothetical protein
MSEKPEGMSVKAATEARWLVGMVRRGAMSVEEARELVAVPPGVLKNWEEASKGDPALGETFAQSYAFRRLVSLHFEKRLLDKNARVKKPRPRPVRKRRNVTGARLPVYRKAAL